MHAADNTGAGNTGAGNTGAGNTGAGDATQQAVRYIITRPCLAEGSLSLLKYLQPLFPADGTLTLQDGRGEQFEVTADAAHRRLTGMGELYRAHNLGVNDVLLISRTEERRYRVECVVKPHARTQPAATERPATAAPVIEKRVVIHATPHVREVRMERVTPESVRAESVRPQEIAQAPAQGPVASSSVLSSSSVPRVAVVPAPLASAGVREQETRGTAPRATVQTVRRTPAPLNALTARMQQHPAAPVRLSDPLNSPIQMSFAAPTARSGSAVSDHAAPVQQIGSAPAAETTEPSPAQATPTQTAAVQDSPAALPKTTHTAGQTAVAPPLPKPAPARVAPGHVAQSPITQSPITQSPAPSRTPETHDARVTQDAGIQNPEDQLAALARLTGYACEHLGSGVVRLRAELGSHSYSVLIATTPQALTTHAWGESCDYMALLTPEDQRPQGIPRFTYAALEALLEHARLAPLTPIDLRGYWNTGSFDQESVESVAELVSAHLAQRGVFSHVLLTLAQQPAHSLVHLPRLAERLGSGVNTAELQSILETLSRAPFLALTPLPNGQYYLRSGVRELLQEFGEYAEGMRRRIRPTPLAATGR